MKVKTLFSHFSYDIKATLLSNEDLVCSQGDIWNLLDTCHYLNCSVHDWYYSEDGGLKIIIK